MASLSLHLVAVLVVLSVNCVEFFSCGLVLPGRRSYVNDGVIKGPGHGLGRFRFVNAEANNRRLSGWMRRVVRLTAWICVNGSSGVTATISRCYRRGEPTSSSLPVGSRRTGERAPLLLGGCRRSLASTGIA